MQRDICIQDPTYVYAADPGGSWRERKNALKIAENCDFLAEMRFRNFGRRRPTARHVDICLQNRKREYAAEPFGS